MLADAKQVRNKAARSAALKKQQAIESWPLIQRLGLRVKLLQAEQKVCSAMLEVIGGHFWGTFTVLSSWRRTDDSVNCGDADGGCGDGIALVVVASVV